MVLDTLNSETPNIKDLSIDDQSNKESFFGLEKVIDLSHLRSKLTERFNEAKQKIIPTNVESCDHLLDSMEDFALFQPESIKPPEIEDELWQMIDQLQKVYIDKNHWAPVMENLVTVKFFAPERFHNFQLTSDQWKEVTNALVMLIDAGSDDALESALKLTALSELVSPQNNKNILEFQDDKEKLWERGLKRLEDYREDSMMHRFWYIKLAETAKYLKILFPERFNQLELDENFRTKMKQILDSHDNEEEQDQYFETAELMLFLSKNKILITEDKIRLISDEDFQAKTPPLPETRNF